MKPGSPGHRYRPACPAAPGAPARRRRQGPRRPAMSGRPGRAESAGRAGLIAIGASVAGTFAVAVVSPSVMEPALPGRPGQAAVVVRPAPVALPGGGPDRGRAGRRDVSALSRADARGPRRLVRPGAGRAGGKPARRRRVLTLVPPFGSSDHLSYAAYGRMLVTGHNPYTTHAYASWLRLGDPVAGRYRTGRGPRRSTVRSRPRSRRWPRWSAGPRCGSPCFVLGLAQPGRLRRYRAAAAPDDAREPGVAAARGPAVGGQPAAAPGCSWLAAHVDSQAVVFGVAAVAVMCSGARGPRPRAPRARR